MYPGSQGPVLRLISPRASGRDQGKTERWRRRDGKNKNGRKEGGEKGREEEGKEELRIENGGMKRREKV